MKWIYEFRRLFLEATERYTENRRKQHLEAVERELAGVQQKLQITTDDIRRIESSQAWTYAAWWPRLADKLPKPIALPRDLGSAKAKEQVVKELYSAIQHIEVVSVVLRFVRPDVFGIISPPVLWLLGLSPSRDHVAGFMRYTDCLNRLGQHYSTAAAGPSNVAGLRAADVDMALWSAAHLSLDPRYQEWTRDMEGDAFFQAMRFRNVTDGLSPSVNWTEEYRLLLAEGLVRHDHLSAATISARAFESVCRMIAKRLGVPVDELNRDLVMKLDRHPRLSELGLDRGALAELWANERKQAVHGNPDLTRPETRQFIRAVYKLLSAVTRGRS